MKIIYIIVDLIILLIAFSISTPFGVLWVIANVVFAIYQFRLVNQQRQAQRNEITLREHAAYRLFYELRTWKVSKDDNQNDPRWSDRENNCVSWILKNFTIHPHLAHKISRRGFTLYLKSITGYYNHITDPSLAKTVDDWWDLVDIDYEDAEKAWGKFYKTNPTWYECEVDNN